MSNDKSKAVILNDRKNKILRSPTSVKETKQAKVTSDVKGIETKTASLRKVTLLDILNYYNLTTILCALLTWGLPRKFYRA